MKIHPPGTVIDRYEVLDKPLGVGGFGAVYPVRHKVAKRRFALKLLHEHLTQNPAFVDDFLVEVRRTADFRGTPGTFGRAPGKRVVQVTDAGVDPNFGAKPGAPFMVMELLEGEGLNKRLEKHGRLSPVVVLDFMKDLACVLDEAHHGPDPVVHRDLKPENLFLAKVEGGEVLEVLDFGIAKAANQNTQTDRIIGTPQFMAPEQWEPKRGVSPQTDLWALGLIVFNALTGSVFWDVETPLQLIPLVLLQPIPRASERAKALGVTLPPAFDEWFARCVARDPNDRFESAGRAVAALEAVVDAWPGLQAPPPPQPLDGLTRPPPPPSPPAGSVGLDDRLRIRQRLPAAEVRALLRELAEKIEDARPREAHDASLVLTPEHVRFVPRGDGEDVILWDPLPPPIASAERRGTHTLVARFGVGDFAYFAPETLRSAKGSERADVWSLAIVTFEVLVGVRFWPQESIPALLHAMESGPVPAASARAAEVPGAPAPPEGFDAWFARCTARDPAARYKTPTRALLDFEKLFAQPPPPRRLTRRDLALAAAGVVVVAALVAAVGRNVIADPEPRRPTVVDTRPVVTPVTTPAARPDVSPPPPPAVVPAAPACDELPHRGNPFVRVAGVGCVQQHEVSEREFAAWLDAGAASSMPKREVSREHAAAYCESLGATLPPSRLWDLLAARAPSLVARVRFPQGDDVSPVDRGANPDDFEGVRDLVGNLAEWTSDGPRSDGRLVVRGARFNSLTDEEAAARVREGEPVPDRPSPQRGFRCAVVREGP